jgi:hypothetical protein
MNKQKKKAINTDYDYEPVIAGKYRIAAPSIYRKFKRCAFDKKSGELRRESIMNNRYLPAEELSKLTGFAKCTFYIWKDVRKKHGYFYRHNFGWGTGEKLIKLMTFNVADVKKHVKNGKKLHFRRVENN